MGSGLFIVECDPANIVTTDSAPLREFADTILVALATLQRAG